MGVEVVSGQRRALEENGREVQLCWADVWERPVEEAASWDQRWSVDLLTWFIVFIDGVLFTILCLLPIFKGLFSFVDELLLNL